jgi:glycosyltransferase involved in cell wall biosynthesis
LFSDFQTGFRDFDPNVLLYIMDNQHPPELKNSRLSWVFFALNSKPTSMRQALGRRTGELDPVVIVENPVSVRLSLSIQGLQQRNEPLAQNPQIRLYRPLHLPERIPGFGGIMRCWNRRLLQSDLIRLIPEPASRIVCYDSPYQHFFAGKLGEKIGIYLAVDDRTLTVCGDEIRGEQEAEKQLLSKVDMIICVSRPLADVLRKRMPEDRNIPIHVLPNGYNERLFDPCRSWPEPGILLSLPRPRILVAGHVSERIDWDGIREAARVRPEWTWLFVGPADQGLREKIEALGRNSGKGNSRRPGFFFHPPVPVSEVPAWIAHCDACAVPYRLNPFTLASSPLKGIECLAMGAPVLSTRIPSLQKYGPAVQWVEEGDGASYAQALDALAGEKDNPSAAEKRRTVVAGDTWAERLTEFRKLVFAENH